jgi:uncharacterized delta-60 repeat protein
MKVFTLAAYLCLSMLCYGQAGSLNTQFNGGLQATSFGSGHSIAEDIAVQPDGKVIVVGQTLVNGISNMALARLNSNGTLDNSFGIGGKIVINLNSSGSWLTAVAIQGDGKIVAGGSVANGGQVDFALLRFLSNGTPDPAFGTNGVITSNLDTYSYLKDLLIQPDGKILVAGEAVNVVSSDYAVARFLSNGAPDASFAGGSVTVDILGDDFVKTIRLLSSGKMIVGGSSSFRFSMIKLKTDGSLDENFGPGGKVTTIVGGMPGNDNCLAIDVQSDGKIIAVGEGTNAATASDVVVARYTTGGQLDNSFANGGLYVADLNGAFDQASSVSVLNNGKILIGGNTNVAGQQQLFVARLTQSGALDGSFGTGGQTTIAAGNEAYAYAMALKGFTIYLAGVEMNAPNKMLVASLNNDVGPLPVRFASFTAQKQGSQVILRWQTDYEEQTKSFVAEKSNDGSSFSSFAEISASGNSTTSKDYRAVDDKPFSDITYYRIKSIDLDGSSTFTKVVYIKNDAKGIEVVPNPVSSFSQVHLPDGITGTIRVELYNMTGQMIKASNITMNGNALSFPIDMSNLKAGSYLVKVDGANVHHTQQIVKK